LVRPVARFRRSQRAGGVAWLSLLTAFGAFAQTPPGGPAATNPAQPDAATPNAAAPAAANDVVTPPRQLGDANVEYPAGATGDADVVLELVISASGEVQAAQAVQGDEPFREKALAAASLWRFEPALRAGNAVAAKIRFLVRFTEPQLVIAPNAEPTLPPTAAEPAAPVPAPIEVTVRGKFPPPLAQTLTRAEVRQLPGAFGDPFRAIEALPGVTPILSGVPFFYVRGAPPGNVGYFLDGIRLPLLYHVGLGPSVVHPAMVERVDLYPGAYPSRYGRFSGGIVAGEVTEPPEGWRGEWQLRLYDAGAMVEAPVFGGRGHVLVGGRYSYTAYLISLIGEDVRLEYWDYQLRMSYRLGASDRISVFGFGSFDYFGEDTARSDDAIFSTEFHRIDLRHVHDYASDARLESAVTFGLDRSRAAEDTGFALNRRVQLRSELESSLSPSLRLRAGVDAALDLYEVEAPVDERESEPPQFDPTAPPGEMPDIEEDFEQSPRFDVGGEDAEDQFERLFPSRVDNAAGVYAELIWDVTPNIRFVPGLRGDLYTSDGAVAFSLEPRLSAEFRITDHLTLQNAVGLAAQPPSFAVPVPGLEIGGLPGGLQRSVQSSFGAKYRLPDSMRVGVTLFHNAFFNMTDVLSLARLPDNENLTLDSRTQGQAYGLEFMFHRDLTRKLGGFVSYTLSRSIRSSVLGQIPASFDRTHVLNLALGYDLGDNWRTGLRYVFYTGNPVFNLRSPRGEDRLPPFHRLDVRLEKRWPLGTRGASCSMVLEVLNTTLSQEVTDRSCNYDPGGFEACRDNAIGPVTIPSLGFEGQF
jgi:outer membrane receptor protein involved in Fe transport